MNNYKIVFNKPYFTDKEIFYISQVLKKKKVCGDGLFTNKCSKLIEERYNVKKVLITTSCSHALDMAAILFDIKNGDEIILPSFSFTSLANSFVLRNAKLRFADIRGDTLNLDEDQIENMINEKTKAIAVIHYAGTACNMKKIMKIAKKHNLFILEDAAHAIESKYLNDYCGTIGNLGAFSFHETKNATCGEGGALLINDERFIERAEFIREKGTNRNKFYRGEVDKYTWIDIGSSYLPSDILSAILFAQLEKIEVITKKRINIWNYYHDSFKELEDKNLFRRPGVPKECIHNGHIYYIILNNQATRENLMNYLKNKGILAVFHYLPLHLSPMGLKMGYKEGDLKVTERISDCILRLPMYFELTRNDQDFVIDSIKDCFQIK